MYPTLKPRPKREKKHNMATHFDPDDEEYLQLLAEYERYMQHSPGAYEDFDDWLELEYGTSRKKALKRNTRFRKEKDF